MHLEHLFLQETI